MGIELGLAGSGFRGCQTGLERSTLSVGIDEGRNVVLSKEREVDGVWVGVAGVGRATDVLKSAVENSITPRGSRTWGLADKPALCVARNW